MNKNILLFWSIMLLASGCTFSSGQLQMVKKLMTPTKVHQALWRATYKGKEYAVTPVVLEGLIVFANQQGDAVAFDGWSIRSVAGLNNRRVLRVDVNSEGERVYLGSGLQVIHSCTPWRFEGDSAGAWMQTCTGLPTYTNRIELDGVGSVIEISQVVSARGDILTLRRLDEP